jgi:DNA-binding response OmpR family regulator
MTSKGKILIVEDQKGFRRIYQDFLEHEGYEVLTAEDGEIGWNLSKEMIPHLILLDLGLPKLNGFEVLQKLKADSATKEIPVIIFSVVGEQKDIDKAIGMGANDYTVKGFNTPRQVLEKIQGFFARMGTPGTSPVPALSQPTQT